MIKSKRIHVQQVCRHYRIENSFIHSLHEYGIVNIQSQDDLDYMEEEHLPRLEKAIRFHHELEINLPGIGVVLDLLDKIEKLTQENEQLRHRMSYFDR